MGTKKFYFELSKRKPKHTVGLFKSIPFISPNFYTKFGLFYPHTPRNTRFSKVGNLNLYDRCTDIHSDLSKVVKTAKIITVYSMCIHHTDSNLACDFDSFGYNC